MSRVAPYSSISLSCSALLVACSMASIRAYLNRCCSRALIPAIAVPPGEETMSFIPAGSIVLEQMGGCEEDLTHEVLRHLSAKPDPDPTVGHCLGDGSGESWSGPS